jgi:hypothetical protein
MEHEFRVRGYDAPSGTYENQHGRRLHASCVEHRDRNVGRITLHVVVHIDRVYDRAPTGIEEQMNAVVPRFVIAQQVQPVNEPARRALVYFF